MATWSPLTTNFAVNLQDSSSRGGVRPNAVQNHHTATNNKAVALSLFAPGGRTVTPNYFVAGKEIWGVVPEDRRAWTSGSSYDDTRAITIETLNSTNAPNWQFASDTMATLILLNADIARRYGIPFRHAINGIYEHKNLYQWFRRSYATACAGPSFNINHVISAASKASSGSNNPPSLAGKEDDEMKPIYFVRNTTTKEYMVTHPEIGLDLPSGKTRRNGNVIVNRGYMITTSPGISSAWSRLYSAGGSVPRNLYIGIQSEARRISVELAPESS